MAYEVLLRLAKSGVLNPETLVQRDQQEEWHPAGEIAGLFHMAGRAEEVSRWRAERRGKRSGDRIQGAGEEQIKSNDDQNQEIGGVESSELSREIKAATYAAALQLRDRYGRPIEPAAGSSRESRLARLVRGVPTNVFQSLKFLLSIPFVLLVAIWSRLVGQSALPKWVEDSLDRLFSQESLLRVFRWGLTLALPNLVAWMIFSWSSVEAQRYPPRDRNQVIAKTFPIWGKCSSEGEFLFLLVDTMLATGIGAYVGVRWLESKVDD